VKYSKRLLLAGSCTHGFKKNDFGGAIRRRNRTAAPRLGGVPPELKNDAVQKPADQRFGIVEVQLISLLGRIEELLLRVSQAVVVCRLVHVIAASYIHALGS